MHGRMFQRLKERQLERTRGDLVENGRQDRVIFIAGRRASESARRTSRWKSGELLAHERKGSTVWCSPLINWTDADMAAYRERFPDCPRNEVSDMLHMSGECLCGAFAHPGELDEIGFFFPEVKAEIEALQVEVRRAGHPEPKCTWGWGATERLPKIRKGSGTAASLCDGCERWRQDEMFPVEKSDAA